MLQRRILAAVGLDWRDLYPPREPGSVMTSCSRPWAVRYSAANLLEIIAEEVTVVAMVAATLYTDHTVSDEDWQRLAVAVGRIQRIRDHIHIGRNAA